MDTVSASIGDLSEYRERVAEAAVTLGKDAAQLQIKDSSTWSNIEVQTYLDHALWMVYDGLLYHVQKERELPGDPQALIGSEYFPVWPGNPFADWASMELLKPEDEFKPGCLVLQVCPPEYYSMLFSPRPLSFELCVYGPDKSYADLGTAVPLKYNKWAMVP